MAALTLAWVLRAQAAPDNRTAAQEAFTAGRTHYNLGEYQEALVRLKEAYRLLPEPLFLFNLGQVYRKLNEPRLALEAYRAYLRSEAEAPEPNRSAEGIRLAQEAVVELQAALDALPKPPPPAPPASPAVPAVTVAAAAPAAPPPVPAHPLARPWVWVVLGGVVTGVAVTAVWWRGRDGAAGVCGAECNGGVISLAR